MLIFLLIYEKVALINLKQCTALLTWDPRLIVNKYANAEIKKRILFANRCFHGLGKHFKLQLISRKTKLTLCNVVVRPVTTCAAETWTLTKADDLALGLLREKNPREYFWSCVG
jgi:hypothetical protein